MERQTRAFGKTQRKPQNLASVSVLIFPYFPDCQDLLVFKESLDFFPLFEFKQDFLLALKLDWIHSVSVNLRWSACRASEDGPENHT